MEQVLIVGDWKLMTLAEAEICFHISLVCSIEPLGLSKIGLLIYYNVHEQVPISIANEEKGKGQFLLNNHPG